MFSFVGNNLLAKYAPLLIAVCSNQKKYPDQELRAAASLSLAKFMLVRLVSLNCQNLVL